MEQVIHRPNSERDRFARALGIELTELADGRAVCELEIRDDHLNAADRAHGGVVFALADAAGASALNAGDDLHLTISSSVNIMRSSRLGDRLRAVARVQHDGRRISSCHIEVRCNDALIATVLAQAARM